ncbi:MAG: CBS domain-containing protein [Candidatus Saccharimonadales bacterium]
MLQFVIAVIFLALAFLALVLRKTYFYLPKTELQRQASRHDPLAATLWRAVAYGSSLALLLWFCIGLGAGVGFVLFAKVAPAPLGFSVIALALWFGFAWMPSTRLTSVGAHLAVWCTPAVVWILSLTQPLTSRLAHFLGRFHLGPHTGLYEKEDLQHLIEQQKHQPDNRVSEEVLELLGRALAFDDFAVHDVVVPRAKVRTVSLSDSIGPIMMDELHATTFTRFPVVADDPNVVIGTLFLGDIVDSRKGGRVETYADQHVFYVHEQDSLSAALHAFRVAKQQILVVVNAFEEYVGIITISDVLGKLIDFTGTASFTGHDDKHAVAAKHEKSAPTAPEKAEEFLEVAEEPSEVIE